MPLPELDPEQRRAALAKAAEARRIRAELKQMLKSGEVTLGQVLDRAQSADALAKMKVSDVIEAMPAYGPVKARRLMEELGIAQTRRIRGLGQRQREALLTTFESRS
jgi:molybdenum cofactor biosynthesis enzyme